MKKYRVVLEITMDDDSSEGDARMWVASVLDTAFKKKNPVSRTDWPASEGRWHAEIPMSSSEHPYKPRVVGAEKVS
jgi:hypothetical protein